MSLYESQIDRTEFGIIAGYLKPGPQSQIQCLLHVKDRSMLASVAETLERELESGAYPNWSYLPSLGRLVQDGWVKCSLRDATGYEMSTWHVPARNVVASAPCDVIFLPPFYLVHTPGLFEGKCVAENEKTQEQLTKAAAAKEHREEREAEYLEYLEQTHERSR